MRARRQDEQAVEAGAVEQVVDVADARVGRDPVAIAERPRSDRRQVASAGDLERVGEPGEERQVDGLGDGAETGDADPQPARGRGRGGASWASKYSDGDRRSASPVDPV